MKLVSTRCFVLATTLTVDTKLNRSVAISVTCIGHW